MLIRWDYDMFKSFSEREAAARRIAEERGEFTLKRIENVLLSGKSPKKIELA